MKTTPKTEKEIYESNLLPDGWYPFTINKATEKTSKAGNEMIELEVRVYKESGFTIIRDWLMDTEFGARKLRHCADTCGVLEDYENGNLEADNLESKEGFCKVTIKKDKDGVHPDQNGIGDYAKEAPKPKGETAAAGAAPAKKFGGKDDPADDIDF